MSQEIDLSGLYDFPPLTGEDLGPVVLQSPRTFYENLLQSIDDAEESFWILSMLYVPGTNYVSPIQERLLVAAKRDIDVQLRVDGYSLSHLSEDGGNDGLLHWLKLSLLGRQAFRVRALERAYQKSILMQTKELENAGAKVRWLNPLKGVKRLVPFINVGHNKIIIQDKKVAWGACGLGNFFDSCFTWIDYAAKTEDLNIVYSFCDTYEGKPLDYLRRPPLPGYEILIDTGEEDSSIYQAALDLVENEKEEVNFVSQFLPGGRLLNLMLDKVKGGTKVVVYTSPEDDSLFTSFPANIGYKKSLEKIKRSEIELVRSRDRHIHAKLLTTLKQRSCIVGSHNLVESGTLLRASENAILSKDQRLFRQADHFIHCIPV